MPRKRIARPEEIAKVIGGATQRLAEAVLSPNAPKLIKRHMQELGDEHLMFAGLLRARAIFPRREFRKLLSVDSGRIAEQVRHLKLTIEEVDALREYLDSVTDQITGKSAAINEPQRVTATLQRILFTQPVVQRFKPEFEDAFRRSLGARRKGRLIPAWELAKAHTPDAFRLNEESAVRGMQKALVRIEKEHSRLKTLGIPSPFEPYPSGPQTEHGV